MTPLLHDIRAVGAHFQILGDFVDAAPYGSGHINDTFCAVYDQGGTLVRYIHQRINHRIFKNPESLMANVERVTGHLAKKVASLPDAPRRALTLVPTSGGQSFLRDAAGDYWRTYVFVEKAKTYDAIETPKQAFEAAKAFGTFQGLLADLPEPRLYDTIPDFHHTPKRFEAMEQALEADVCNRAKDAAPEIAFALKHKAMTSVLVDALARGDLPERVTHNDTKLNNVMLDDASGEGVCVIDLDTVMPGTVLYDFGDMVRTSTSPGCEDERDLTKIYFQVPLFEALVRGYLSSAGTFLTSAEKSLLAFSGKLITLEIGMRFLADHLAGDVYFKVHREGHNLDRCRTQFKLVRSIEENEEAMRALVARL